MRLSVLLVSLLFLASACDQQSQDTSSQTQASEFDKLTPDGKRALKIARAIADDVGSEAFATCVTSGAMGVLPTNHEPDEIAVFNVALDGCDFDTETCECDPHFSVDIFFDDEGQFISASLIDA